MGSERVCIFVGRNGSNGDNLFWYIEYLGLDICKTVG